MIFQDKLVNFLEWKLLIKILAESQKSEKKRLTFKIARGFESSFSNNFILSAFHTLPIYVASWAINLYLAE